MSKNLLPTTKSPLIQKTLLSNLSKKKTSLKKRTRKRTRSTTKETREMLVTRIKKTKVNRTNPIRFKTEILISRDSSSESFK
jgi:hypothetical protein